MPNRSQRHPSRDERPTEWENVGKKHVHMHPGGVYEHSNDYDELAHAKGFWHDEGNPPEGHHVTMPSQGRLFDPDVHEGIQRQELGAKRLAGFDAYGDVAEEARANELRSNALGESVIPTSHLQPRTIPRTGALAPESKMVIEHGLQAKGALGHYTGPVLGEHQRDYVTVDPEGPRLSSTIVHEMGHRQHLGLRDWDDPSVHHPRARYPDPLMEAHADAYVDRYGGPHNAQVRAMSQDVEEGRGKFGSYQYTGYSTRYENQLGERWSPADRALYAGVRAHASETGEHTDYQQAKMFPGEQPQTRGYYEPDLDATIHSLLSNSPHAAQAMRQTGLKDVGQEAFRRHRDRQLLRQGQEVQPALFHELTGIESGKVRGYTPNPDAYEMRGGYETHFETLHADTERLSARHGEYVFPQHMSRNQFGEKPRTAADVNTTLGVERHVARPRGFDIM